MPSASFIATETTRDDEMSVQRTFSVAVLFLMGHQWKRSPNENWFYTVFLTIWNNLYFLYLYIKWQNLLLLRFFKERLIKIRTWSCCSEHKGFFPSNAKEQGCNNNEINPWNERDHPQMTPRLLYWEVSLLRLPEATSRENSASGRGQQRADSLGQKEEIIDKKQSGSGHKAILV